MQLHIAAFDFEFGDVLLDQQFDQFFDFFLIHRILLGRMTWSRRLAPRPREDLAGLG
jgi:hypothetical protein